MPVTIRAVGNRDSSKARASNVNVIPFQRISIAVATTIPS